MDIAAFAPYISGRMDVLCLKNLEACSKNGSTQTRAEEAAESSTSGSLGSKNNQTLGLA